MRKLQIKQPKLCKLQIKQVIKHYNFNEAFSSILNDIPIYEDFTREWKEYKSQAENAKLGIYVHTYCDLMKQIYGDSVRVKDSNSP
jgi:hypothetical protein